MEKEKDITIDAIKELFVLIIAIQTVNKCPVIDKLIDNYLDRNELHFIKETKTNENTNS